MTIQRQYSLPNCTLILEGLGDNANTLAQTDSRPLMSILINAECYLSGKRSHSVVVGSFLRHWLKQ